MSSDVMSLAHMLYSSAQAVVIRMGQTTLEGTLDVDHLLFNADTLGLLIQFPTVYIVIFDESGHKSAESIFHGLHQ